MSKIQIIKEPDSNFPFVLINKPKGLPSAPLNAQDENNALIEASKLFPEILKVQGKKEIEHGLVHRLDTVTDGLLIIAATQEGYEYILKLQNEGKFIKYYSAKSKFNKDTAKKLEGFPEYKPELFTKDLFEGNIITAESFFRSYGNGKKSVRPVTKDSSPAALKKLGKPVLYKTEIKILNNNNGIITTESKITAGFRHQVRCHNCWIGLPIEGDRLYNPESEKNEIEFTASKIELPGTRFELA